MMLTSSKGQGVPITDFHVQHGNDHGNNKPSHIVPISMCFQAQEEYWCSNVLTR